MIAPPVRARTAALAGAVVGVAAVASLLGSGTSTAASPPALRSYGPPTGWSAPAPVRWLPASGPLLGAAGVALPLAPERPGAAGPTAAAVPRPAGPPGVVGPRSRPAQVRTLQRLLNARLAEVRPAGPQVPALRVDGDWGPATTRAVRRFQAQVGLPVDGQVGPATLAALRDGS